MMKNNATKRVYPKNALILAVVVVLVSVMTGCGNSNNNSGASAGNQKNDKNVTITIGVEAGSPYGNWYKEIAPTFTENTGIAVKFEDIPLDNMHTRFLTEAASETGALDIYTTDQPWVSEFAENGFLEPLDSMISEEDKNDFVESALQGSQYNGKIYALPYLVHTPVLYYRTDLFEKAGLNKAPETWEEFREYARILNDPENGVYGTIIEGKQGVEPTTHLINFFLQAGGSLLEGNDIAINSPQNLSALKHMLAIQHEDKTSPAGAVSFDNADAHNLFMQGNVAMIMNWPYMYTMANDPNQSKVAGKYEIALLPRGSEQTGASWGWGFGISSSSKHKEEAMEWLKWITSKEIMVEFGKKFINPVSRTSAIEALNADPELSEENKHAIAVMSQAVNVAQSVTTTSDFPKIQQRLMLTLSRVMTKQSSPEDELQATEKDLQSIINN